MPDPAPATDVKVTDPQTTQIDPFAALFGDEAGFAEQPGTVYAHDGRGVMTAFGPDGQPLEQQPAWTTRDRQHADQFEADAAAIIEAAKGTSEGSEATRGAEGAAPEDGKAEAAPEAGTEGAEGSEGAPEDPYAGLTNEQLLDRLRKAEAEPPRTVAPPRRSDPLAGVQAPKPENVEVGTPEIDYSDMPDFNDAEKYPTMAAAEDARRAYYEKKASEAAAGLAQGVAEGVAQRTTETLRQQAAAATETETAAHVLQEAENLVTGDLAAKAAKIHAFKAIASPEFHAMPAEHQQQILARIGGGNLVAHTLMSTRMRHEAQSPTPGAESSSALLAALIDDADLSAKVAALPWRAGTTMLGAIASARRPTEVLRRITSDEGKPLVDRWTSGMAPAEVFREVAVMEANMQTQDPAITRLLGGRVPEAPAPATPAGGAQPAGGARADQQGETRHLGGAPATTPPTENNAPGVTVGADGALRYEIDPGRGSHGVPEDIVNSIFDNNAPDEGGSRWRHV